ncbi:MAG TPA: zf-TFIIB domain-containing protein [Polyangiaceae bacterium]|jgi:Zn-finger nucleic acid-binding protein
MTPYRAGGPGGLRCVACGAERSADARACTRCGEEVPAVRCAECMTLNPIGESACRQCGAELGLAPEPEPTRLVCPRGCGGLVAAWDLSECERCGGIFVSKETLAALVTRHRGPERKTSIVPPAPAPDTVVYLPCPACNARMNRTIFGKSSGVIVDVCKTHGTWFDARELTASLAFVERGGIELVEKRERERKESEARRAALEGRIQSFEVINRAVTPGISESAGGDALVGLIDILLSL